MVAFESTARETYARFRKGDSFVASGYVHEYEVDGREGSVIKEEFVARKIGHNVNKTDYVVQRGRHAAEPVADSRAPAARRRPLTGTSSWARIRTSPTTRRLPQRDRPPRATAGADQLEPARRRGGRDRVARPRPVGEVAQEHVRAAAEHRAAVLAPPRRARLGTLGAPHATG